MGVQGLMTVCRERQGECTESVDLAVIAKKRDGIELIVDFNCFKRHLVSRFWTGLSDVCDNPYIKILGGEYSSIERHVSKLIEDLKSLKIQLVFFTVGAKGSSTEAFLRRENTWIERDEQGRRKISELLDACRGRGKIQALGDESSLLPLLLEDQFMAAAKRCDCEFNQNPAGEVDMLAIRALRERPKAYAILANDTDFCIYPDNRFIPIEFFDIENDLQLDKPVEVREEPRKLNVKVITTEKVMSMFQVRNHTELIEMTIVSGNDYTKQFMRGRYGYHRTMALPSGVRLESFAQWIRDYGNVEGHPILSEKMRDNAEFRNAVYYSRNRYSLQAEPDAPPQKGNITQVVAKGIADGKYPTIFMSILNNYYWYKLLLEDIPCRLSCSEHALKPLRRYIYRIVLPREENLVKEHGRRLSANIQDRDVKAVEDPTVPSIDEILQDDEEQNLRHFHAIMSHQEQDKDTDQDKGCWFDRYERKDGFIVYLLRYFLLQNRKKKLDLSKYEYLALAAMVLGENEEAKYQRLRIIPTVRCVTIGNWFQNLYRHVSMLASALSIKSEFPLPSEIFSGSRWTSMYMVLTKYVVRSANEQVKVEMDAIIARKRDMIHHTVDGIFTLDD